MFTVCPKCALTLVVTATDLRVAQGYVRCGRCLNVFNALARLSEERPTAAPEPPPDAPAPGSPEQAPSPPPPASASAALDDTGEIEIELDADILMAATRTPAAPERFAAEADVQPRAAKSEAQLPASEPDAQQPSEPQADAQPPASKPDAPPPASEPDVQPLASKPDVQPLASEPDAPPASSASAASIASTTQPALEATVVTEVRAQRTSAAPLPAARVPPGPAAASAGAESSPAAAETADAQQTNTPQPRPDGIFELEARRPRAGIAWKVGAGVLAIALALQIVNHYRDALAANPALRSPLTAVYSALGVKLAPRWNIHAYDVRQLGASVAGAPAGEIVVRASVKNSASRAQPLPVLRVTLQDRFGNRIAARDVLPGDYLPSSVPPSSLLAAGSRVDATMVFVDPGPQAVGFEIDACLRERSGEVACAHGP